MQRRVLITGGLGLIGSRLAEKCVQSGEKVTILTRSKEKLENIEGIAERVELRVKDVRDISQEDVADQDQIFHFASTVDNYNIHDQPYLDVEVNCGGTLALLEACREFNPQARIVYPSTFFVNGNLDHLPATPQSPCEPRGLYPATKLAAEHFCRIYNEVFDMNTVTARLTNVFGERESRTNKKKAAFNFLIGLALDGQEVPVYDGGNFFRDYIFVDDVADACQTIAERGERGEIYYVGNGKAQSFRELIEMVVSEAGSGRIIDVVPPEFHNRVGIKDFYCDNTPLRNLGWTPKVPLSEGIRRVVEHYKDESK
jgi:UDP-glucose 4-epimerase